MILVRFLDLKFLNKRAAIMIGTSNPPTLVSRFRSSHHCAAHSFANFGSKGTLTIYDSSAVFGFEVPTQTRGYDDRNFKSTALPREKPYGDVQGCCDREDRGRAEDRARRFRRARSDGG